jgi:hypothetical protein
VATASAGLKPSIVGTWKCDGPVFFEPGVPFRMSVSLVFKSDGTCWRITTYPPRSTNANDPGRTGAMVQKNSGMYRLARNSLFYLGPKGRASEEVHVSLSKNSLEISGKRTPKGLVFRRVPLAK